MRITDESAPNWFRDRNEECEFFEMLEEARDLATKIYNLTDFLIKSSIDVSDRSILENQRNAMITYFKILQARIRRVLETPT